METDVRMKEAPVPSISPTVSDEDPAELERIWAALTPDPTLEAPLMRAVMISSVDGTTTVDGRTAGLATPTDQLVFHAMRARADLVLVGSATALSEGYGAAEVCSTWRDRRSGPAPLVLLLTRTLSDEVVEHCVAAGPRVGLVTVEGVEPDRVRAARDRGVDVHVLGPEPLSEAIRGLAARLGSHEVAVEGGPQVLASLLAEGAIDELVLSLAPEVIIGGDTTRLVETVTGGTVRVPLRIGAAFTGPDGGLYTRWIVGGAGR